MAAQHKRPGRRAREERIARAREREEEKKRFKVVVGYPRRGQAREDISLGRLVIWAEWREKNGRSSRVYHPWPAGAGGEDDATREMD